MASLFLTKSFSLWSKRSSSNRSTSRVWFWMVFRVLWFSRKRSKTLSRSILYCSFIFLAISWSRSWWVAACVPSATVRTTSPVSLGADITCLPWLPKRKTSAIHATKSWSREAMTIARWLRIVWRCMSVRQLPSLVSMAWAERVSAMGRELSEDLLRRFDVKKGVQDIPDILKTIMAHFIAKQSL